MHAVSGAAIGDHSAASDRHAGTSIGEVYVEHEGDDGIVARELAELARDQADADISPGISVAILHGSEPIRRLERSESGDGGGGAFVAGQIQHAVQIIFSKTKYFFSKPVGVACGKAQPLVENGAKFAGRRAQFFARKISPLERARRRNILRPAVNGLPEDTKDEQEIQTLGIARPETARNEFR